MNLVVTDRSSGMVVERVAVEETSSGVRLADDLKKIAGLMAKQLTEKYPAGQYEISLEEGPPRIFTMTASSRSLLAVNVSALIFGGLLLSVLLVFRHIFALKVFLFMLGILALYLLVDYLVWQIRGIRRVEIGADGLAVYRGKGMKKTLVKNEQITGVDVFGKAGRRVVNVLAGGRADRSIPGVTLFSGSRIRLTNDAFDDAKFNEFVEALRGIARDHDKKNP